MAARFAFIYLFVVSFVLGLFCWVKGGWRVDHLVILITLGGWIRSVFLRSYMDG